MKRTEVAKPHASFLFHSSPRPPQQAPAQSGYNALHRNLGHEKGYGQCYVARLLSPCPPPYRGPASSTSQNLSVTCATGRDALALQNLLCVAFTVFPTLPTDPLKISGLIYLSKISPLSRIYTCLIFGILASTHAHKLMNCLRCTDAPECYRCDAERSGKPSRGCHHMERHKTPPISVLYFQVPRAGACVFIPCVPSTSFT